jgi:hypothetical protein
MTDADTTRDENKPIVDPRQQAMQDEDIAQRLEDNPEDPDAQLDAGLDQSMDGSDPVATVQPGDTGEPLPSSGYDEDAEKKLTAP